jgi:hypothetical protein
MFKGSLKPLSAKAFANSLHGGRGSLQHPGDLLVYGCRTTTAGMLTDVSLKQDTSTIEHTCRSGTRRDELAQMLSLGFGELNDVLFVHGDSPTRTNGS